MSSPELVILLAAAVLAGAMNAVAGGGTLLTFPALLAFGMPSIQANATSTLALVVGLVGSAYAYRSHMPVIKPWLLRFGPASVVGGIVGAWLLTVTPEKTFSALVPFLLLFATILFMAQGLVRRWIAFDHQTARFGVWGIAAQLLIAIYGGYFGAGIGILMLAAFGLLGFTKIHEMNALKTILASAINVIAATYFIMVGLIAWPQAIVLSVGATAGYFFGAHYSQKIPEARVRQVVVLIGLLITVSLFWKQFA
ncbi:MAG: sulfite exporter TauE/SafE family protein [Terrimicrobiaceae bacterium]